MVGGVRRGDQRLTRGATRGAHVSRSGRSPACYFSAPLLARSPSSLLASPSPLSPSSVSSSASPSLLFLLPLLARLPIPLSFSLSSLAPPPPPALVAAEHCAADKIVCVGHSHFFREIFRRFLHPAFAHRDPHLSRTLQSKSVPNCSVLCCEVDFSLKPYMIRNVNQVSATLQQPPSALREERSLMPCAGVLLTSFAAPFFARSCLAIRRRRRAQRSETSTRRPQGWQIRPLAPNPRNRTRAVRRGQRRQCERRLERTGRKRAVARAAAAAQSWAFSRALGRRPRTRIAKPRG